MQYIAYSQSMLLMVEFRQQDYAGLPLGFLFGYWPKISIYLD